MLLKFMLLPVECQSAESALFPPRRLRTLVPLPNLLLLHLMVTMRRREVMGFRIAMLRMMRREAVRVAMLKMTKREIVNILIMEILTIKSVPVRAFCIKLQSMRS
jgi:hypothetical protein